MFRQPGSHHTGPASGATSRFHQWPGHPIISRAIHEKPNPLLEDLTSILPTIAANAFMAEQDRKVPAENIALLKSIGLHRAFQPKAFGGMELSLPQFADCIALLAGACASTAWAMSLLCTHSHQLALFSAQLQQEVWGTDPNATASSSIAPFAHRRSRRRGVVQRRNGLEQRL